MQEQSATKYYMQDVAGNIRNMQTRREAAAVDLPNGQTLFALLCDSNVTQSALDPAWQNDWVESARRITAGETPRTALVVAPTRSEIGYKDGRAVTKTEPHYPMLVRFRDSKDPTTVELVDPAELAATFGPAVKLKRITVQITDEPVTVGIVKRLDRIGVEAGHGLDRTLGVTASPTLAQKLGYSDFVNGDGN